MRVSVGFCIRRSIADANAVRGKTFSAYGHRLYPTYEKAAFALKDAWSDDALARDPRFSYDVCEAFMHVEDGDE